MFYYYIDIIEIPVYNSFCTFLFFFSSEIHYVERLSQKFYIFGSKAWRNFCLDIFVKKCFRQLYIAITCISEPLCHRLAKTAF